MISDKERSIEMWAEYFVNVLNRNKVSGKVIEAKLENLEFDNVEWKIWKDRWNNFRNIVCEVDDGVLGKWVRNAARNDELVTVPCADSIVKEFLEDGGFEVKKIATGDYE